MIGYNILLIIDWTYQSTVHLQSGKPKNIFRIFVDFKRWIL